MIGGMQAELSVRRLQLSDRTEALRLLALQQASYLAEAQTIGFADIPPLSDTLASLIESRETFWGAFRGEELVGCIAYEREGPGLTICRMMVHPDWFRHGIASLLLRLPEEQEHGLRELRVSAVTTNTPAVRLYEAFGFIPERTFEIAPGIVMAEYRRSAAD
jgi:ribosomal protein S18 acetylase RimI-like enzyme